MKEIPLTKGYVALVDDEDFERLGGLKWQANTNRTGVYAQRREWIEGRRVTVHMHRLIMDAQPGQVVDHKNGNGLDNRKANLRLCTVGENNRNARKRATAASRFKGVTSHRGTGKWQAHASLKGKWTYLGLYETEELAALAYNSAALNAYGEFACLNEVENEKGNHSHNASSDAGHDPGKRRAG